MTTAPLNKTLSDPSSEIMNEPDNQPVLHLGIRHRRSASLIADFYPDGMPEDWQPSYLAMMTQAIWLDDRDEDLADILAAIIDAPTPIFTVWATDDAVKANLWQAAHPEQQLITVSQATAVWSPQAEGNGSVRIGARIGMVPSCDQPAHLRAWLEQFVQQAPSGPCALFVDGQAPSVPTFDRLRTLTELMGL